MKNNAERMKCVLSKAACLKKQRERHKESFCKAEVAVLSCLLLYCIGSFPNQYESAYVADFCGTVLLVGGVVGYVLTAVLTFVAATIITVVCIKIKNRRNQK